MFKIIMLIISVIHPQVHAIGISPAYADLETCETKGKAEVEADAKVNFPPEMIGPIKVIQKCLPAAAAEAAYKEALGTLEKPKQVDPNTHAL